MIVPAVFVVSSLSVAQSDGWKSDFKTGEQRAVSQLVRLRLRDVLASAAWVTRCDMLSENGDGD